MRKISFAAMAGLLIGLASCSTDIPEGPGKVLENETQTFVKISLVSSDGLTRSQGSEADDALFEDGLDDENTVKNILLVFYDGAENYVGDATIDAEKQEIKYEDGNDDLTIARFLTATAEVNLPENTNHPAYVVAFVNPTKASGDLKNLEKLSDLSKVLRRNSDVSPLGMTMNNSVYYDEVLGQPVFATPVDFTSHFFKTKEEAERMPALDITVERVQAKVELESMGTVNEFNSSESNPDYTLQFVPEKWFVNATEKNTFLIKNYRGGSQNFRNYIDLADYSSNLDFNTLKDRFDDAGDYRQNRINESRRKRSYWALDPTYFSNGDDEYPEVSYDVSYTNANNVTINEGAKLYPLTYRSYNDIKDDMNKSFEYCLENTMNIATLKSDRAKSTMSSVVMLGHYVIKDNKTGQNVFDGLEAKNDEAFYIRHDSDKAKTILLNDENAINYFLDHIGTVLYVKVPKKNENGSDSEEFDYQPLTAAHVDKGIGGISYNDFKLVHPSKIDADVLGQAVVSEQWRTLNFSSENDDMLGKYYVYDVVGNGYGYIQLDKERLHSMHKVLYSAFGLVEKFSNGKAYFNVPLKHIFYNSAKYDNKTNSNAFDAEKVQLGDYGVVRNHVYKLKINSISGLGSGIGDLNQPIVPPTEVENYYISARLNILKWRIVSQSVDL